MAGSHNGEQSQISTKPRGKMKRFDSVPRLWQEKQIREHIYDAAAKLLICRRTLYLSWELLRRAHTKA